MTTESWGVALVVLLAVLVGAAVPVLLQLRATLRAAERTLQRSGPRLDAALGTVTTAASRIDALVARLEGEGRLEQVVAGLASLDRLVHQVQDGVRVASAVGAAVGPALAAAVHAFRSERDEAGAAPPGTPEAVPAAPSPQPLREAR